MSEESPVPFRPSSPETEERVFMIELIRRVEGIIIKSFSPENNEGDFPNEITVPFDEIKNSAAIEELTKESIEAIVKFFTEKEYKIEVNEDKEEFKIKMPEKLKGY